VTRRAEPARRSGSRWQRALGGALAAVLLLPVPVFAFTWATSGVNSNWTNPTPGAPNTLNVGGFGAVTNEPDWLFIQTTATSNTQTAITLQRDFFPAAPNQGMNAQAVLSNFFLNSGTSMTLAAWVTRSGSTTDLGDIFGTNAGTPPLTISGNNQFLGNVFGTPTPILGPGRYTLHVQFSISPGSWHSLSSTQHQVVFQFFD
jgi:hypothetical protein